MSDPELAVAAAQRYVSALNAAVRSRESAEFRKTFVPGCVVCTKDAERIDGYRASGRSVVGGAFSFSEAHIESVQGDSIILTGTMRVDPVEIRDSTGKVVESHPAFANGRRIMLLRLDGVWLVEGLFA